MDEFLRVLTSLSKTGNNALVIVVLVFWGVRKFFDSYFVKFCELKKSEIDALLSLEKAFVKYLEDKEK